MNCAEPLYSDLLVFGDVLRYALRISDWDQAALVHDRICEIALTKDQFVLLFLSSKFH